MRFVLLPHSPLHAVNLSCLTFMIRMSFTPHSGNQFHRFQVHQFLKTTESLTFQTFCLKPQPERRHKLKLLLELAVALVVTQLHPADPHLGPLLALVEVQADMVPEALVVVVVVEVLLLLLPLHRASPEQVVKTKTKRRKRRRIVMMVTAIHHLFALILLTMRMTVGESQRVKAMGGNHRTLIPQILNLTMKKNQVLKARFKPLSNISCVHQLRANREKPKLSKYQPCQKRLLSSKLGALTRGTKLLQLAERQTEDSGGHSR